MNLSESYIDKEGLRRAAPIALIAAELGIHFDVNGKALCPFHEDRDPSLHVWQDENGVERWGCYPCGIQGDIYDLVRRLESLTFPESMQRVEDLVRGLPVDRPRLTTAPRPEFDEVACRAYVVEAQTVAAGNDGWLCVATGLIPEWADADYRVAADRFLRTEFRWGVSTAGETVMPHFDAAGRLTGCKIRALDGRKWSFPGSKFGALYGSWRPRRSRYVLLTEGEGDAAYAALQGPPVDVLALPKGAGTYLEEWGALEADVYFLAFDADEKGTEATRKWLDVLTGRDARVCRLPQTHDLKSSRPVIIDLLKAAVKPSPIPGGVLRIDGRFERVTNNGPRTITNWTCTPTARLESVDSAVRPALEVEVDHAGHRWRDVISLDDLASGTKFRAWSATRSLDCLANDSDVQHIGSVLLAESLILPEVFQTARLGSHAAPARYRYSGRTVVAPNCSIGKLPWRYVGPTEARDNVLLGEEGPLNWAWLEAFLQLNDPSVTHPLLAWLAAAARRDELTQFPLMFLGGTSGSGKTTTAQLAIRLMGSKLGVSLASVTQFALLRSLALSTTLPVFIDEWSLQSRTDARETVQAVVPVIYDGGVTPRGRADLTVVEYRLMSPVLIAGEDSFHLDREADRMIALRLRRSLQHHAQLQYLISQPIHHFGRWFAEWLVAADGLPEVPVTGLTRPQYNRAVLQMGWDTLRAFVGDAQSEGADVPEVPEVPDLSQLDMVHEDRENEYEAFLGEGAALRDGDGMSLVWEDPVGRGVWVRFRMLTSPRNISGVDVELPGRSRAMKQYFADRYELHDERVTPPYGTRAVRATLIMGLHLEKEEG